MVRGCGSGKTCQECARNCLMMHQKQKNPSLVVSRFFKILVGEDYSQILFLPPSFAQRSQCYVGQKTHLEDATGQRWPVMISDFLGSMAFLKGWNEFSVDHGLEVGQVLVFSYIKESHFVVQVFGRSGREILKFNRRGRPKKRSRDGEEKVDQEEVEPLQIVDENVEPLQIVDENVEPLQIVDGTITDSGRERLKFNSRRGQPKEGSGDGEEKVDQEEVEPLQIVDENVMVEPTSSPFAEPSENLPIAAKPTDQSLDDPALMLNRDAEYDTGDDRSYLADLSSFETGNNILDHSLIRMLTESETNLRNDKEKNEVLDKEVTPMHHNGSLSILSKDPHVGQILRVKEELGNMGDVWFSLNQACTGEDPNKAITLPWVPLGIAKEIHNIVKSEPDLFAAAPPFLVDVNYLSFLALPIFLPPIEGQMVDWTQVVYLKDSKDPTDRLWPVLYSARSGFPVFLDGWKRFCEENVIQVGDVCKIKPEDSISGVYSVDGIASK